ncbi:MAG: PIN domain-containing protein [Isosphaeraceae bacterium]
MSRRRVLDTNRLIAHWRRSKKRPLAEYSRADVAAWARQLIEMDGTSATLTPVVIEFLCRVMSPHELELSRAFLDVFDVIDQGEIRAEDWALARRYAAWIPRDCKSRDFADCLIAAIAKRLDYSLLSSDRDLQRRSGKTP